MQRLAAIARQRTAGIRTPARAFMTYRPIDPAALRARRERLKLTQQQVADAAGIMREAYARVETGRRPDPQLSTAVAIAHALRCKVDDLLAKPR
jgi:DNA-binding XRE family transcriptional regulator